MRSINRRERYVAIDVETTGLYPWKGDRVIEVGAVALEGDELMAEFTTLVKVPRAIPANASQIHGITDAMLIGQPTPDDVFPMLHAFIRDSTIVAHNASFDMVFIRHEFERLKLSLTNRHICTLEMSRSRFPCLPNHKLETVYQHLIKKDEARGLFHAQKHRALDDARMVAAIWFAMERK